MPGRPPSGDEPARPPLPSGFGTIWVTVAIDLVGFGVVLPILPRYAEQLHVSPTMIGLVVGVFSLAQLVCSPFLGRLSDRFGRKPVLIFSLCGTAVGSLLTGLAHALPLLLVGRLVDGASGASVSVAQASVADVAPPDQRPRLLGLLGAAFGVGFVVGPAIGTLAALGGPHIPFFVAAVIAGVNAVVALRRLPETHPGLVDAGAAPTGGAAPGPRPALLAGLRGRPVRLIAMAFVALVAFSGFEGTFALLLADRFGLTLSSTGAVFTAIGIVLVAVQGGMVHPVVQRLGEAGTLRMGLVANTVGLGLLAVDGGWFTLVPSLVLLVVGQGLVTPTVASALAGVVAPGDRGRVLGFQQSAGSAARFAGPFLAGVAYEHLGVPWPYALGALLVAAAVALVPAVPHHAAVAGPV